MGEFFQRRVSALVVFTGIFATFGTGGKLAEAAGSKKPICVDILTGSFNYKVLQSDSAYEQMANIRNSDNDQKFLHKQKSRMTKSFGSDSPVLHSFEKEGLDYEEIAEWFPSLRTEAKSKLKKRFAEERALPIQRQFMRKWLLSISQLEVNEASSKIQNWASMSAEKRLQALLSLADPFAVLSVEHRAQLFEYDVLKFTDIQPGPDAPPFMDVGDDDGSYEVRMSQAIADRTSFANLRDQTEVYLEGKVGHQHLFHGWPSDDSARTKMAPYYIELLDSTTWYLFWRQMKRDPEDVDSILTHPYLGVYTRSSLDRLHRAVVANTPKHFNDKFRMVGARRFKANKNVPGQGDGYVPDWELRSGNKGVKREFVENMLEARLSSGDYSGLQDYREISFDPSTPIEDLAAEFLSSSEIAVLAKFQKMHPSMKYNTHVLSTNHIRNRILSPLLPWEKRIPMGFKVDFLKDEQNKYAKGLVKIAQKFIRKAENGKHESPTDLGDLRAETVEEIEELMFKFASRVRLDLDFERYLRPIPNKIPEITVVASGPVNVNEIPIGVEYSHRFPIEAKPRSRSEADQYIKGLAEKIREEFKSDEPIQSSTGDGHGHGTVVKYKVTDANGEEWRVEWDGISRYYVDGRIRRSWGGHAEIPSPKFSPQSIDDGIRQMFVAARSLGMFPSRAAGGGHFNIDIEMLKEKFPAEFGARGMANLISFFESNQELILFMWMHPRRKHAATPVELQPDFAAQLDAFKGGWDDLGRLLYRAQYFNPYVGRKPKYVPLNAIPLMTPILPPEYKERTLDIRNPESKWFPHFGNVTGRVEARWFDAPTDEYMAALQIKYFRALLNKALNADRVIPLIKLFSQEDFERWKQHPNEWLRDADAHLKDLGLDPKEFRSLLWDSYYNRLNYDERSHDYETYDDFLPAVSYLRWPEVWGILQAVA